MLAQKKKKKKRESSQVNLPESESKGIHRPIISIYIFLRFWEGSTILYKFFSLCIPLSVFSLDLSTLCRRPPDMLHFWSESVMDTTNTVCPFDIWHVVGYFLCWFQQTRYALLIFGMWWDTLYVGFNKLGMPF